MTISPADPTTDATLQANATAADVDGDTVSLRFEWLVDGVSVQDSDVDTLDGSLFDKHQDVVVRVTPNDGFLDGETVESAATTIVNSLPSLASAAISPDAVRAADTVTCVVDGWTDADGDAQDVQFEWTVDGVVVGTAAQLDAGLFAKGDAIACAATPFDGEDQGAVVTSSPVVVENTAPIIASAALSSTAPVEGDTLSVALTGATDADGDTITYAYKWTVNGTQVATTPTLDSSLFAKGDTIAVIVTPNDGAVDGTPVTSDTATAANSAPVLATATLSKTNPAEGDTLSVTLAGGTDADGDAITYTYQWLVNGTPVATTPTLGSALFAKGNTIVVQVTPNDGTVNGAPVTSNTATAINTAPVLGSAVLSKTNPVEGDTLSVTLTGGADIDGDSVTYAYRWLVNGAQVATTPTLASSLFAKGNTIVVEVTPNDGTIDGTMVTSNTATALNSAPVLGTVTLSKTNPVEGDTLSVTLGGAVDADGDAITYTYKWLVNGTQVATTATLGSALFAKGNTIVAQVTPNDGTVNGATVASSTATVLNSLPVMVTAAITPTTPNTTSLLSVTVASTDADGDAVTYAYSWTVNGAVVGTAATLPGTSFIKNDVVIVTVTPNDGTANGAAKVSTSVTVLNSVPTAPVLALSPAAPRDADNIACLISTPSTDLDGDTISYAFSWTVNGTAYTGATLTTARAGDTIPAASTSNGQTWACRVVPTDGVAAGPAATVSAIVVSLTPLNSLCGNVTNGTYCGGNCTNNTAAFADAYCKIGGFTSAASYTEQTSGSWGPTWYYQQSALGRTPIACSELGWSSYGAASFCTCITSLVCNP